MSEDADLARLARSLKGAPTGVFLALVLHPGHHTTTSLQLATGYSPKAIRQALGVLELEQLVRYSRPRRAWQLVPGTRLLDFLRRGLGALAAGEENTPAAEEKGQEPDTAVSNDSPATAVAPPAPEAEKTPPAEDSAPPDTAYTTTAPDPPDPEDQSASSKQAQDAHRRELRAWLMRGGIGRNSPKMRQLLAAGLNLDTVKAHVLERTACEQGLVKECDGYGIGLLIRRLEDGDPPPPLRCADCLHRPDRLGLCRCDYDEIVKR